MHQKFGWPSEIFFVKVIYRNFLINQKIEVLFGLCVNMLCKLRVIVTNCNYCKQSEMTFDDYQDHKNKLYMAYIF